MNETSGQLRAVVEAYLNRRQLTDLQITLMRAYLRQWIFAPGWQGPVVDDLRQRIDTLTTRKAIDEWLDIALAGGIDPL